MDADWIIYIILLFMQLTTFVLGYFVGRYDSWAKDVGPNPHQ